MSSSTPNRPRQLRRALDDGRVVALGLMLVVAVTLVARLPGAFDYFSQRSAVNGGRDALARSTAAADLLQIDNEFVYQALKLVPAKATFSVETPATDAIARSYGMLPVTKNALPGFMQNLMLPRREVDASRADYLLCYACDTSPFDRRGMKRLWQSPQGYVIGGLRR